MVFYKEKNQNTLICGISYKTWMGGKPLRIRYDEIDGFIKISNKIWYLVLFDDWWDKTCDRIKYLMSEKNSITDCINHNLQNSELIHIIICLLKKILTFHVIILL